MSLCHVHRALDVLEVIAKVLGFNEEQKRAVGLLPPTPAALISTLLTAVVGTPKPLPPIEVGLLLDKLTLVLCTKSYYTVLYCTVV